jgi:hypothetical protein
MAQTPIARHDRYIGAKAQASQTRSPAAPSTSIRREPKALLLTAHDVVSQTTSTPRPCDIEVIRASTRVDESVAADKKIEEGVTKTHESYRSAN